MQALKLYLRVVRAGVVAECNWGAEDLGESLQTMRGVTLYEGTHGTPYDHAHASIFVMCPEQLPRNGVILHYDTSSCQLERAKLSLGNKTIQAEARDLVHMHRCNKRGYSDFAISPSRSNRRARTSPSARRPVNVVAKATKPKYGSVGSSLSAIQ